MSLLYTFKTIYSHKQLGKNAHKQGNLTHSSCTHRINALQLVSKNLRFLDIVLPEAGRVRAAYPRNVATAEFDQHGC